MAASGVDEPFRYVDGDNTESWKTIAEAVPGRTNKACRKRWKHSLHPSIKKTPWEPEEDELLLQLYAQHPGRWAMIGQFAPCLTLRRGHI